MSEPIPESIPTSADPKSNRPVKRQRGPITASGKQASEVEALFANPDKEIKLPSDPKTKTLAAPPEIVTNVQGSSAGAGSGEFHVYKASRRREYERLRMMDEETKKEEADKDFEEKQAGMKKKDDEKTSKNRARRQKQKDRAQKKKAGNTEETADGAADGEKASNGGIVKKPLKPMEIKRSDAEEDTAKGGEVQNADEIGITFHDED